VRRRLALLAIVASLLTSVPCHPEDAERSAGDEGPLSSQAETQKAVPRSARDDKRAPDRLRVLFVGNSFTYVNDLPAIVAAISRADGGPKIDYRTVAFPGFSLEDHWRQGDARRELASGRWDYVVMQQGPSASEDGREVLLEYARRFAPLIRKAGAAPAFYGVWPASVRTQDFPGAAESYRQAAMVVQGVLMPAAEAWQRAFRRDKSVALYGPDGLHPSPEGSYLAALVVYAGLTNRPVANVPATLSLGAEGKLAIPDRDAAVLREAAVAPP